ncbi:MFS transporter [Micromonospora eburnea]|uniref:Predicted arabinose efflux permease, MFS family n=1 Tax=Micromonospora eburnea TaxID=227316 RepID=A0A1C6UCV4_9ACTN|nr:MFS transporter [Micromonospora eburnea]SCL51857.1 Predicted arabinose efflux permease, MFS family [Micromonospora eburnea]
MDRRPLAIPAYRRLWVASVIAAVGGSFSVLAIPTQLFTLTGSSATVGVSAAVSLVALLVAALWGGALADAMDRRRLLLGANGGLALTYAGLWAQAALDLRSVPVLMALVAGQGLSYGAIMAAMGAAVPRVVPADLLAAANGLSSLVRYTGSIVGPLLAGVLIPVVGLGVLYLLDTLALVVVAWSVFRLPPLPPAPPSMPTTGTTPSSVGASVALRRSMVGRMLAGFRFLFARRLLVALIGVDLAAMVFGAPWALYPELAEREFGGAAGGGFQLGVLYASFPAGVVAVGLLSGVFTRAGRHGVLMASAAAAWGVTVVVLGLAPQLWLAAVALVAGGGANFVLSTFRRAISQANTEDALRGRIEGSMVVVTVGGPQVANLLHGVAGAAWGPRWAISVGGVLTVLAVAGIIRALPQLWQYDASLQRLRSHGDVRRRSGRHQDGRASDNCGQDRLTGTNCAGRGSSRAGGGVERSAGGICLVGPAWTPEQRRRCGRWGCWRG